MDQEEMPFRYIEAGKDFAIVMLANLIPLITELLKLEPAIQFVLTTGGAVLVLLRIGVVAGRIWRRRKLAKSSRKELQ